MLGSTSSRLCDRLLRKSAAAAFVCLVWHASSVLAYSCNDNHYVNSSGHVVHSPSCGEEHEKRTAECRDGSIIPRVIAADRREPSRAFRWR